MTREEEIKDAGIRLFGNVFKDINRAFELGAQWADEHPQNPLIKFADKKPKVGERVIFWDDYFNDGEFYSGVLCEDGKINILGIYEDLKINIKATAYWMPIPKLEKGDSK